MCVAVFGHPLLGTSLHLPLRLALRECLWPLPCLLLVCTTLVCVLFVATPTSTISLYYFSICTLLKYVCTVCGHPMSNCFTMYYSYYNSRSSSSSLLAITATSYYYSRSIALIDFTYAPAITATPTI